MSAIDDKATTGLKPMCPAPGCATVGSSVPATTISSLLKPGPRMRLGSPEGYRFCAGKDCAIVYWHPETGTRFTKDDLIVRVGLKERTSPRPICYCFGFDVEDIERQVCETAHSTIPDEITERTRAGLCHCEDANPQGTCCLGNVRAAVERARESAGTGTVGADRPADLLGRSWARALWALAVVGVMVGTPFEIARPILWTLGFGLAGSMCVVNAARSRRLHCIFTGPVLLAGAVVTVLRWADVIDVSWTFVGLGVLVGVAAPLLVEILGPRKYVGEASAAGDCCGPAPTVSCMPRGLMLTPLASSAGAVVGALLGSACCWLPLVLVACGASAASASRVFETYRPVFLAVAAILLGAGFYKVYRTPLCLPDGTCASPSPARARLDRIGIWMATLLVVAAILLPRFASAPEASSAIAVSDEEAVFTIQGMTCESCTSSVRSSLERLPGVGRVEVSFDKGMAKVRGKKDARLPSDDAAIDAIRRAGYEARRVATSH